MTLTPAGRIVLVLAALAVLLSLVGVAARVWAGQWDAEQVIAVAVTVPTIVALVAWRWSA